MGCVSWSRSSLDHFCYEHGALRFPSVAGLNRRTQFVAPHDRWPNRVVVQVKTPIANSEETWTTLILSSFLVKDAHDDIAGTERLKS